MGEIKNSNMAIIATENIRMEWTGISKSLQ